MGRAGALFLACLKIASGAERSICIMLGVSCSGDGRPALPGDGSEGLRAEIYCVNAPPVAAEEPLERSLAADVVRVTRAETQYQ